MDRRQFLKMGMAAGGFALTSDVFKKAEAAEGMNEFVGVLVDTTRCIGCRKCEEACAKANGKPVPDVDDKSVFEKERTASTSAWTVVNRYETEKGIVTVKRQCMHCNQPACGAACLVKAMMKKKEGPVIWRESKCMGCRYCMISCPFDAPKFEYYSPIPKIEKCHFCYTRLEEGKLPACVQACPVEALMSGTRRNIISSARGRISENPDRYYSDIYGEREVGGTGWLYLSSVPFDQIGFRTNLSTTPYPEYTKGFLYGVPVVFVLWPAFLLGIHHIAHRTERVEATDEQTKEQEAR
jgi:Fe-S-cluster-containing dehydrogenase component